MAYLNDWTVSTRTQQITNNIRVSISIWYCCSRCVLTWTEQPYPLLYNALLYGTECQSVWTVPLPLDYGMTDMMSIDDLVTDWWLKGGPLGGRWGNNLADLSLSRFTISHFPTLPSLLLDHAYTVLRPELPLFKNRLLEACFGPQCRWRGDLRIVKHIRADNSKIMHMAYEDLALVDLILKWYRTFYVYIKLIDRL